MPKRRKSPKQKSDFSKMERITKIHRAPPIPYSEPKLSSAEKKLLRAILGGAFRED